MQIKVGILMLEVLKDDPKSERPAMKIISEYIGCVHHMVMNDRRQDILACAKIMKNFMHTGLH